MRLILSLSLAALILLSGCNLPVASSTPTAPAEPVVMPTFTSPALPDTPTSEPSPTLTPTLTPEPSLTPTPEIPLAQTLKETPCYAGPAGNYERVTTFPAGTTLQVLANDLGGGFFFVSNPAQAGESCWALGANLSLSGQTAALPRFTAPPSPLPAPAFSAEYKKIYVCGEDAYVMFIIQNTGGANFRSAYIKATDVKSGASTEQAVNAFDLLDQCVVAKNIAPLKVGGMGYLYAPPFKKEIRGRLLKVVLMLCTEQNLKGACVTQTLEVKPH